MSKLEQYKLDHLDCIWFHAWLIRGFVSFGLFMILYRTYDRFTIADISSGFLFFWAILAIFTTFIFGITKNLLKEVKEEKQKLLELSNS